MTHTPSDPDAPIPTALRDWQEGRYSAALDRLDRAARNGDEAALTLLVELGGHEPDPASTRARAFAAMEAMPPSMMRNRHRAYYRAAGHAGEADWRRALCERHDQAEAGDWLALTELGLLALMSGETEAGTAWLERAAGSGSGLAIAALLRLGCDSGAVSPAARDASEGFVQSGHPMAQALVQSAAALPLINTPSSPPADPDGLLEGLARTVCAVPAPDTLLNEAPRIASWTEVLPGAVCDYLTVGASPLLRPAEIHDPATGQMRRDPYRSSLTAAMPEQAMDLVSLAIKARMAALAGRPVETGEPLAVLAYRPGEEYRAHFDFIVQAAGTETSPMGRRGQRVATSLIRLNSEFEGGATRFPRLDIAWTGGRGSALSFDNVTADGQGDKATLHTGEPVTHGVKVIASLWLRERA